MKPDSITGAGGQLIAHYSAGQGITIEKNSDSVTPLWPNYRKKPEATHALN